MGGSWRSIDKINSRAIATFLPELVNSIHDEMEPGVVCDRIIKTVPALEKSLIHRQGGITRDFTSTKKLRVLNQR